MLQNGPDENWKATVLLFLHEVYDVVRLCKVKIPLSRAAQRGKMEGKAFPCVLYSKLFVQVCYSVGWPR